MAKFGKLPTKNYNIYHFNFSKLLEYGKLDKNAKILEVNQEDSEKSYKIVETNPLYEGFDEKGNCQLFDQTLKALKFEDTENVFEDIYVVIDFSDFMNNKTKRKNFINELNKIENGIKLYIKDKPIHVVDFTKSNTMSKACCLMYINKEYLTAMEQRITFGLSGKGKFALSKWYAYSGLCVSDATILKNITFNEDELVVVPDAEVDVKVNCITAISVDLIYDLISNYRNAISRIKDLDMYSNTLTHQEGMNILVDDKKYKDIKKFVPNMLTMDNILKKLQCYKNSQDYERIINCEKDKFYDNKKAILEILDQALEVIDIKNPKPLDEVYRLLGELTTKYSFIQDPNKPHEVYWENFNVSNYPTKINKFDGEGLISIDLVAQINDEINTLNAEIEAETEAKKNNKPKDKERTLQIIQANKKKYVYGYSFQIRMPFIKGVVNSCDIVGFCKEHGITTIYGKTFKDKNDLKAYDVSKIKMVLTESQFKCAKLLKYIDVIGDETPMAAYMRLLNKYDYSLAINHLEYDHKNEVDLNYQVFSTIPFNKEELEQIVMDNDKAYKNAVSGDRLVQNIAKSHDSELEKEILRNVNYYNFYMSTKRFSERRKFIVKAIKRKYLELKFQQNGYRRFLCGDCLDLLYHVVYHKDDNKPVVYMKKNEFYAPKSNFSDGEKCFILRNPHYSRNEIAIMKNSIQKDTEREKYFGHLSGVLMFNSLSMMADRLGGADYDGDSVIVMSGLKANKAIRALQTKEQKDYRYPVIQIPGLEGGETTFEYPERVKSLYNTFNSRVGIISNAAFGESITIYNQDFETHDRIALYTIINGLEIDSAKKGIKPMMLDGEKHELAKKYLSIKDNELVGNKEISEYSKKYIKDHAEEHNIYYLMDKSLDYSAPELKTLKVKKEYDVSKIEKAKLMRMIEAYCIYTKFNNLVNMKRKYNIVFNEAEGSGVLYDKITEIIKANYPDYDQINQLIENIGNSVLDIKETLKTYCFEKVSKFHYMTDFEEKIDYLNNQLNINLSIDELQIICNFKNEGYMLLYLILNYLYNSYVKDQEQYKNKPELSYYINYINDKVKLPKKLTNKMTLNTFVIEEMAKNFKAKYEELVEKFEKYSIKDIREELYKDLKAKTKDISLDHFLVFESLNDNNMIFDVLSEQTKTYLKERGEKLYE